MSPSLGKVLLLRLVLLPVQTGIVGTRRKENAREGTGERVCAIVNKLIDKDISSVL